MIMAMPNTNTPSEGSVSTPNNTPSNSSNNIATFNADDKVFAKVRGYPPWPAKVRGLADETPSKIKYHVYFYGTEETAICKQEELYDYLQHREKFGKPSKRKYFQEALEQIEHELDSSVRKLPLAKIPEKDSDEEGTLVIDETPNQKKGKEKGLKRKHASASSEAANNSTMGSESTPVPEITSRSGRKIKPKKFSDEAETSAIDTDRNASTSSANKDTLASQQEQSAVDYDSSDEDINLLLSPRNSDDKVENGEVTKKSRKDYKENLKKRVEEIKNQTTSFPAGENLELLKVEVQLLDSDCRIKSSLGLSRANCDECLRAMDEVLELNLNALMLKKHPEVVDTVKKLRRYVGNIERWKLTTEQEDRFKEKAGRIRLKADHMYNKFKNLFTVPSGKTFLEVYNAEVTKFNNKITNLSVNEVYGLVQEPED